MPEKLIQSAFAGMVVSGPRPLLKAIALYADLDGVSQPAPAEVVASLADLTPNDPLAILVSKALRLWDYLESPEWADGTGHNTAARRARVLALLDADQAIAAVLNGLVPPYLDVGPLVISALDVDPWFDAERAAAGYYWNAYVDYLRTKKHWTSIDDLDRSTSAVIANTANPTQPALYQAKGLVVGHVQSGKTANFTGVIAKAADAGCRLVIVLTGTTNILRRQTQRRIDKELVGRELVGDDYELDPDWVDFASHGGLPSKLGSFDWLRLTGPEADFRLLGYGSPVLEFKKADPSKPFFDPANLLPEEARIMVVKKNATVLAKVAKNLKPYEKTLADIPALIIDDESDQASLDTTKPTAGQVKQRTKVNGAIVRLLKLLPRAQYIGYTATPFASVFVNPDDQEGLFPRDFIIALDPPPGYMGAAQFHDIDGVEPGRPSNEADLVRSVRGPDEDPENLLQAIDSFVLAGGIKLFREAALGSKFPHHTMLVHVSQIVDDHTAMAALIERTVAAAGYRSPDGVRRLRRLWETDFAPVSGRRGPVGGQPTTFEELIPGLSTCVDRLFSERRSAMIINGQKESDTPDFDRDHVWRILVGGNKLSRGYTVEGLTVSYYRRRADAADTLMQMGRWFGYREGFADLVRLYVGREEPKTSGEVIDLYKAFEGACRDEIAFRQELRRYVGLPGEDRIKPIQVPPLVQAHLLRPTSPNKMYNAKLLTTNFGGEYREPTVAPFEPTEVKANQSALAEMLDGFSPDKVRPSFDGSPPTTAYAWIVPPERVMRFLKAYRWLAGKKPVDRDIEYLGGGHFDPQINDWLVLAPQLVTLDPDKTLTIGGTSLTVKNRQREESQGRYAVYSEPDHVLIARRIAGIDSDGTPNGDLAAMIRERRGVILLYPVQWYTKETVITPGFSLAYPPNDQPKKLIWSVATKDN